MNGYCIAVLVLTSCIGLWSFVLLKHSDLKVERRTQDLYFYDITTSSRKDRICIMRGYDENDTMIFQTTFHGWDEIDTPRTMYFIQQDKTAIVKIEAQYCRNE